MAKNSNIEWTDHTFNPWIGCTKVSPGCAHCYAETLMDTRYGRVKWGAGQPRQRTSDANWKLPLRWDKAADEAMRYYEDSRQPEEPRRPRVFCASLADWLDDEVPIEWLRDLLDLVRRCQNLDFLLLTKRPENWRKRLGAIKTEDEELAAWLLGWYLGAEAPANVWIGTTVEDQQRADERIPELLKIPARVRFLSCEPLLGPVNIERWLDRTASGRFHAEPILDWVICGGESGPKARPMHPTWANRIKTQCQGAGVAFFFKQWGEWLPDGQRSFTTSGDITWGLVHVSGRFRQTLNKGGRDWSQDPAWEQGEEGCTKVGKKTAGRLLDGVEHSNFPEVRA